MQSQLDGLQQTSLRLSLIRTIVALALYWLARNSSCFGEENIPNDSYFEQITKWREVHEEKFKSPRGWLALIGHHWLKEGVNSFGVDPSCEIQLPPELNLKSSGSFLVSDGSVNLHVDAPQTIEFSLEQRTFKLDAISESPNELFVLFKDLTSGKSTYGPGRFLDIELPDRGKCKLDFNEAYSPPCAYSPHTLCPLPPRQNHLDIAIEAGEKLRDTTAVPP